MYLVSSCLAGICCRYDGKSCENKVIAEWVKQGIAIPVCPEQLAGLPAPRSCSEIVYENDCKKVMNREGQDLTEKFINGALKTLGIAKVIGIKKAILKSNSPSCGCGQVYDGTFSGKLIGGNGITADLLLKNGIEVCTEEDIDAI